MRNILFLFQIITGILLILSILIQQKGSGIGASFGGDSSLYRTKRGAERLIFYSSIVLSIVFILSALFGLIIK